MMMGWGEHLREDGRLMAPPPPCWEIRALPPSLAPCLVMALMDGILYILDCRLLQISAILSAGVGPGGVASLDADGANKSTMPSPTPLPLLWANSSC